MSSTDGSPYWTHWDVRSNWPERRSYPVSQSCDGPRRTSNVRRLNSNSAGEKCGVVRWRAWSTSHPSNYRLTGERNYSTTDMASPACDYLWYDPTHVYHGQVGYHYSNPTRSGGVLWSWPPRPKSSHDGAVETNE